MDKDLTTRAADLGDRLRNRGESLATAESCTGGWVAKACTDITGSSDWFDCGFVTYSNRAKQTMLGVSPETLETSGAVSEQTVQEMVQGVLHKSAADWAVAISGIAGPGGGTPDKPVGTVWFAWAGPDDWLLTKKLQFDGDRDSVRRQSVEQALVVLLNHLKGSGRSR